MKPLLILILLAASPLLLFGQLPGTKIDSLRYEHQQVFAYAGTKFYRTYPVGIAYPRSAAQAGIDGIMSFTCRLTPGCRVEHIDYENSLGRVFEEKIEEAMRGVAKIYRIYEYKSCEKAIIKESINFHLGL